MNIPCAQCSPCDDVTIPTTGYQSEAPDQDLVLAYNFGIPGNVAPLNSGFTPTNCVAICEAENVELADQCAEVAQITCAFQPQNQCELPPGPEIFFSNEQSAVSLCPDGIDFTFVVPQGAYAAYTQALADSMASSFANTQVLASKVCLGALQPSSVCAEVPYSASITATGPGPYRFTIVSGTLPPGLTFESPDAFHVVISGTPVQTGNFAFTVEAVDPLGNFLTKVYFIDVFGINPTSLPGGTPGLAYSATLAPSGNVTGPVTLAIVSGSPPSGLSFNASTGVISGTPTTNGTSTFDVQMVSSAITCTQQYTIAITSTLLWSPAEVSPLHWYAADQISGFTSGSSLYNWPDLGTGNNALGANSGGGTPLYETNQLNGLPVVVASTNNNANLRLQNSNWTPGVNSPLNPSFDGFAQANVFMVVQVNTPNNTESIFMSVGSTGSPFTNILFNTLPRNYCLTVRRSSADGLTEIVANNDPSGNYDILAYEISFANALASFRFNGAADFTNQAFSSSGVSANSTATQFPGDPSFDTLVNYAEIIIDVANQPLSIIQKYEGYLAWKWGLQANLPSNHPYKSSPPLA